MKLLNILSFIVLVAFTAPSSAQDAALFFLKGSMAGTFLNPAFSLQKNVNISLAGIKAHAGTDGPSISSLTSINAAGNRYIDVKKISENLSSFHNLFAGLDIHTLDIGIKTGPICMMAGHGFRSSANVRYPKGLLEIAAKGNAPFIGQTLEIGTAFDVLAYNELYLGAQTNFSNLSVGIKGKILYGTANLKTEKSNVLFQTRSEFYQLELDTDYLVRSSGLLRYQALDSITVNYSPVTFDNLFYNNRGFAFDAGIAVRLSQKWLLSASVLDIGNIKWDFFPRKYSSKGNFTFEGVDILDYLGDTTSISVGDTLLEIVKVHSSLENYTTKLNSRYTLGCVYEMNDKWSFFALYSGNRNFGYSTNRLSLSALRKFSFFHIGLNYSVSENDYSSFGLFGRVDAGPFTLYLQSENIMGLFRPLDSKNAGLRLGTTLQF